MGLPSKDSPEAAWWRDSMKTRDARLQWWRDARFGMFVHWGVYSGLGNQFQGRKGGGYAEHIQRILKIPIPLYRQAVAGAFNPTDFNADEWIRTAKQAGMGYFVITAKHHDGFAMWPTKVNTYNIRDATPFGRVPPASLEPQKGATLLMRHPPRPRDPLRELRDACRKYGVKFGFYYSHAFDWGNENAPGNDWDYKNPGGDLHVGGTDWWNQMPEFLPRARKYEDDKAIPQLLELIRNYDPDIFWFDTPGKLPPSENLRIMKAVRQASARVVINGRIVRRWGDYESTTDRPAEFPPHDGDWEGIPTTNESYGWNPLDDTHKPASHFIRLLAKAAARGGNILMNVGPMGDGRMDPKDVSILNGIGLWWKFNGASIRGTTRSPLPVQAWGESTRKANTLYLHVFAWPADGRLVVGGLKTDAAKAWLLADPKHAPLKISRLNPLDVFIEVPKVAPDGVDSVVALEFKDDIAADSARLLQPSYASDTLRAFDAEMHGSGLRFGAGKTRDAYVYGWSKPDAFVRWPARLDQAATFEVSVNYDAVAKSAGGAFKLTAGTAPLEGTVRQGDFQTASLGRISLPPGPCEIRITPTQINGGELMRLRGVELKPVTP